MPEGMKAVGGVGGVLSVSGFDGLYGPLLYICGRSRTLLDLYKVGDMSLKI